MAVESASCGFVFVPYTHTHTYMHTLSHWDAFDCTTRSLGPLPPEVS